MNVLLYTFLVTGLWDIILRKYAETTKIKNKPDFVKALIPYFKENGVIKAAANAGLVGLLAQIIIMQIVKFPPNYNLKDISIFIFVSFMVSGLIGFPLEKGRVIPSLTDTYYKDLGRPRSFFTDAYSGLIVQFSLLFLLNMPWIKSRPF